MAKIIKQLTDSQIKNAKPKEKLYRLRDGNGLALKITPVGSKIFEYRYRRIDKKEDTFIIGEYPTITLAQARIERDKAREAVRKGLNPKNIQAGITFAEVTERWYIVKKTKVTERHALQIWGVLQRSAIKEFGYMPVDQLTAMHALNVIRNLEAKGRYEIAKRTAICINDVLNFAVIEGHIAANPCALISKAMAKAPPKTGLPTIKSYELGAFLHALNNTSCRKLTRYAILLQLHTMTRPAETAEGEWAEIDFERRLWTIPAVRMKRRREHVIPLSNQALKILKEVYAITGRYPYIFPGDKSLNKSMHPGSANILIRRMGYKGKLVAHGLRALASTVLNDSGLFLPDWIEAALSHAQSNEVRAAYNRALYLDHRREMMQWWSDYIDNALINEIKKQ